MWLVNPKHRALIDCNRRNPILVKLKQFGLLEYETHARHNVLQLASLLSQNPTSPDESGQSSVSK